MKNLIHAEIDYSFPTQTNITRFLGSNILIRQDVFLKTNLKIWMNNFQIVISKHQYLED